MVRILMTALILVLFAITDCYSQNYITKKEVTGGAKKAFTKGMAAYSAGKNRDAIKEFSKALKSTDNFIDAEIQRAAAYYDLKEFENAEKGFESVIELSPKYKTKVVYMLGKTEMLLKKYSEAIEHFNMYQAIEVKNNILLARAKKYALDCAFVQQAVANKVPFEPVKLSDNINTDFAEYLPALTADEQTMIFTRKVNGQEDFFICKRSEDGWRIARPLTDINTPANEGAQSVSADGKILVFTACNRPDGQGSCDLYFSEVKNKRWTKPKNIGAPINTRAWESQPSISADGKTLYFASNRSGSEGEQDIWYSKRREDGTWNTPKNAGDNINTANSDQSPFIHPDGQTLYFMSDGWPGMGNHDLFYSRKNEQGIWSVPTNLGYPINSPFSEGALVISLDGKTAYFASDRENITNTEVSSFDDGASKADTDIYSFELYENARPKPVTYVRARVLDAKTEKPLIAKVEFVNLTTGEIHSASTTDEDGDFLVCLPLGKNYSLNVNKEKYIFHSENFGLSNDNAGKPYFLDIDLRKLAASTITSTGTPTIIKSEPIILKNVFFDTGSATLRSESFTELGKLEQLLKENPTVSIEIYGHTDDVGSDQDNLTLSQNRAHAVYDYLVGHGVQKTRLAFKGFGETTPIETNDTDEGRQLNRRTEFVIVE